MQIIKRYQITKNGCLVGVNIFPGDIVEIEDEGRWRIRRSNGYYVNGFVGDVESQIFRKHCGIEIPLGKENSTEGKLLLKVKTMFERQNYYLQKKEKML
jgi:hypothetical protein